MIAVMPLPKLSDETAFSEVSRHERKELEKIEKEKTAFIEREKRELKQKNKKLLLYLLMAVIVALLSLWIYSSKTATQSAPYAVPVPPAKDIHWHADIELETCGKIRDDLLKLDFEGTGSGTHALHTHGDNKIHIETSIIWKKEDIALGKFFDAVGLKFSETRLLDKYNGNECTPGKAGKVKMSVNNKENFEFRDYVPKDGDKIKLVFE